MAAHYDAIGTTYSITRGTDPYIASRLYAELRGATRIVNIGAGTGSYEPDNVELVAVEPSSRMIAQRKRDSHKVVQASAEALPFEAGTFSHAMTVLSIHHWEDRPLAFREIRRVTTEKFVAVTWDPQSDPFWLTRDYFPEIHETDKLIFPTLEEFKRHFDDVIVHRLPIPSDCKDGFLAAFWKRPEAYLSSTVRQSMSPFSSVEKLSVGLQKLREDLASGVWAQTNRAILGVPSLDVGYRIISATVRRGSDAR